MVAGIFFSVLKCLKNSDNSILDFLRGENRFMKQKTACLGLFSAVAIILGYVESLVPVLRGFRGLNLDLPIWEYFLF